MSSSACIVLWTLVQIIQSYFVVAKRFDPYLINTAMPVSTPWHQAKSAHSVSQTIVELPFCTCNNALHPVKKKKRQNNNNNNAY